MGRDVGAADVRAAQRVGAADVRAAQRSADHSGVSHSAAAPSFASAANDARRELLRQCSAAEYELRAHQAMAFFAPEHHGHDDHLNALALLVQATKVAALRSAVGSRSSITTHEPFPFAGRL